MTVDDFIRELQSLKPSLREKQVVIQAPNGLLLNPSIKQLLKEKHTIFNGPEGIESMIITYE